MLWWFEWKLSHIDAQFWALGPLLLVLFGKVTEPWRNTALGRKHSPGSRIWEFTILLYFLFTLGFLYMTEMCSLSFLLWPPVVMPYYGLCLYKFNTPQKSLSSLSWLWLCYFIRAIKHKYYSICKNFGISCNILDKRLSRNSRFLVPLEIMFKNPGTAIPLNKRDWV